MLERLFTRRGFLGRLALLLGITTTGSVLPGGGARGSDIDTADLEALLDTLIPADRDPGALEAGVLEVIAGRIDREPVMATRYRRLLAWIAQQSTRLFQESFHRLPADKRDALLSDLYYSTSGDLAQASVDLHVVLEDCFHAFYSSPAAERVIGYHPPIEGGYPGYAEPPASHLRSHA